MREFDAIIIGAGLADPFRLARARLHSIRASHLQTLLTQNRAG